MKWRGLSLVPFWCAGVLAALLVVIGLQYAFGQTTTIQPHDWIISNPDYKALNGSHCCGGTGPYAHCQPMKDELIETIPGQGWRIIETGQVFLKSDKNTYRSEEGRYWACRWLTVMPYVCFFYLEAGS